jgi:hemolysin D
MWGRHLAVLHAAWAARATLAPPLRQGDEAAFLPAALSLQDTPAHPAPRRLAWALMALFTLTAGWAVFGQLDIVAVAPGRVVVSDRTKLIQPLERSVVRAIHVRDGQQVEAGQVLIELDPTAAQADRASVVEHRKSAESDEVRAQALLRAFGAPQGAAPVLPVVAGWSDTDRVSAQVQLQAEWSDLQARRVRLAAEQQRREAEITTAREVVAKLEATLPLARQREADVQQLAVQGFMSGHAGQDRMRERIELERDLATARARLAEAQAALREAQGTAAAYAAETVRALRDREGKAQLLLAQTRQEQSKAARREELTTLRAPVAGTVQQLAVHTAGGVATEAQALMVIVPREAQVTAEVMLENKDIGFVRAGQAAEVKLETFPFTRYGTLAGEVVQVTQDAVQDDKRGAIFLATVRLKDPHIDVDGRRVSLSPGMNLTAEIKTGRRRVIEYLLSPIEKAGRESLRER